MQPDGLMLTRLFIRSQVRLYIVPIIMILVFLSVVMTCGTNTLFPLLFADVAHSSHERIVLVLLPGALQEQLTLICGPYNGHPHALWLIGLNNIWIKQGEPSVMVYKGQSQVQIVNLLLICDDILMSVMKWSMFSGLIRILLVGDGYHDGSEKSSPTVTEFWNVTGNPSQINRFLVVLSQMKNLHFFLEKTFFDLFINYQCHNREKMGTIGQIIVTQPRLWFKLVQCRVYGPKLNSENSRWI